MSVATGQKLDKLVKIKSYFYRIGTEEPDFAGS